MIVFFSIVRFQTVVSSHCTHDEKNASSIFDLRLAFLQNHTNSFTTMNQQQMQQNNHQGEDQSNQIPAPIAPNQHGSTAAGTLLQGVQGQGMAAPHILGLMTNPAFAAAAAASPLFPPAAMITNPGAFYAMPDIFANGKGNNSANGAGLPHMNNAIGNHQMYQMQLGQQAPQLQTIQSSATSFPLHVNAGSPLQLNLAAAAARAAVSSNNPGKEQKRGRRKKEMSPAERVKQNRDRNRQHARSTRLRKKAYIQRLKELVEGLHSERTEEVRQRRVAIQHLAEVQDVRRAVIRSFLRLLANYEKDKRKWSTILEDDFWLKQPVTPYRCFRRSEIEQVSNILLV
jgi:hypothetical protein